jgi:hypothetical protein
MARPRRRARRRADRGVDGPERRPHPAAAVVVCAPPHLARTRLFFQRLYRGSGVDLSFHAAHLAPTARAVVWELLAFPFVPVQLRHARAELAGRRP